MTKEQLDELERLADIGRATEEAFQYDAELNIYKGQVNTFESVDDLIGWYRGFK